MADTLTISYETHHFRGGAPPYRGYHPSGTGSVDVHKDATMHDVVNKIKQEVDPGNSHDLYYEFETCEFDLSQDPKVVFGKEKRKLIVKVPMGRGMCDIGEFGDHSCAPGSRCLKANLVGEESVLPFQQKDMQMLVDFLSGSNKSNFQYFEQVDGLRSEHLVSLKQFVDGSFEIEQTKVQGSEKEQDLSDFKLEMKRSTLVEVIGEETVVALETLFADRYDEIVLRRCCSYGKHINFHVDFAAKTMQVAVSGDDEYSGGKLVYLSNKDSDGDGELKCVAPSRPAGSVTVHGGAIVHGVTELKSGVRYGLFFIQKKDDAGRGGNAWLTVQ